jgi:hypothetical protein
MVYQLSEGVVHTEKIRKNDFMFAEWKGKSVVITLSGRMMYLLKLKGVQKYYPVQLNSNRKPQISSTQKFSQYFGSN